MAHGQCILLQNFQSNYHEAFHGIPFIQNTISFTIINGQVHFTFHDCSSSSRLSRGSNKQTIMLIKHENEQIEFAPEKITDTQTLQLNIPKLYI
jgi:hypothetical protein